MRVIVAGAVAWKDFEAIRRELAKLPPGTTVVHGDCDGADAFAGKMGRELGLDVVRMEKDATDREKYGRLAWMGLNERMLAAGAELILAFHPDYEASHGTKHLVELARAAGVEARVFGA